MCIIKFTLPFFVFYSSLIKESEYIVIKFYTKNNQES